MNYGIRSIKKGMCKEGTNRDVAYLNILLCCESFKLKNPKGVSKSITINRVIKILCGFQGNYKWE